MRLLVTARGAEDYAQLPPQPDPPRKKPVAKRPRALLRAQLTELADSPDATTSQLRMLAIGAVVCDTGIRAGEMCSRRIEDLSPALEELRVVRRPQGWSESDAFCGLLPLSGLSKGALKRWLPERKRLLPRVEGTATVLWVSLHDNHQNVQTVPAGTPLMPRGLARTWTRTVVETNVEMMGQPSWEPLPTRMEQLRRGVQPKASRAPIEPDAEKAAVLLDNVAARGHALAQLRLTEEEGGTAELQARIEVRRAVRNAWAEGIEHALQLSVLAGSGLRRRRPGGRRLGAGAAGLDRPESGLGPSLEGGRGHVTRTHRRRRPEGAQPSGRRRILETRRGLEPLHAVRKGVSGFPDIKCRKGKWRSPGTEAGEKKCRYEEHPRPVTADSRDRCNTGEVPGGTQDPSHHGRAACTRSSPGRSDGVGGPRITNLGASASRNPVKTTSRRRSGARDEGDIGTVEG
ncbi:hypothetical protein ACFWAX_36595, partial [Streptomyces sp. NPDC059956]